MFQRNWLTGHHTKKQFEALHHETESHNGDARAIPCEQSPFGGEKYAWIFKIRHVRYPFLIVSPQRGRTAYATGCNTAQEVER